MFIICFLFRNSFFSYFIIPNAFLLIWDLQNRAKREGMFGCVFGGCIAWHETLHSICSLGLLMNCRTAFTFTMNGVLPQIDGWITIRSLFFPPFFIFFSPFLSSLPLLSFLWTFNDAHKFMIEQMDWNPHIAVNEKHACNISHLISTTYLVINSFQRLLYFGALIKWKKSFIVI